MVGRRFFGAFLEGFVDLGVLATVVKLLDIKVVQTRAGTYGPEHVDGKFVALGVVYLVYVIATKIVTLGLFGWTPGMLFMSLRCVRRDGRPPGLGRAFVRTFFYIAYQYLQCFFVLTVWVPMVFSKAHRGLQDMLAGTYVIDGIYLGHLLMPEFGEPGKVYVGPLSVTRKEAEQFERQNATASGRPAGFDASMFTTAMKNGQPFLDKNLDTYVTWNAKQDAWLAFDKASNTWYRVG